MYPIRYFLYFGISIVSIIVALDALYYIFQGILPSVIIEMIKPFMATIGEWSDILCWPVAYVFNFFFNLIPGDASQFFPIMETGIWGAEIHWIPVISVFVYTGILKFIDETTLKSKMTSMHQQQNQNRPPQ